jgi:predicted RNase H-like nuclease (RuvC/YqgF family)
MNYSFVDKILKDDSIQIHGNLNTYCNHNGLNPVTQSITNEDTELDEFKNRVKIWLQLDNEVKELTKKIKLLDNERKQRKKYIDSLTPHILNFMSSNEIEELNSKEGRLRYKSSKVKEPLSQKGVRNQLYEQFPLNHSELDKIFVTRNKVEKVTLRRLM